MRQSVITLALTLLAACGEPRQINRPDPDVNSATLSETVIENTVAAQCDTLIAEANAANAAAKIEAEQARDAFMPLIGLVRTAIGEKPIVTTLPGAVVSFGSYDPTPYSAADCVEGRLKRHSDAKEIAVAIEFDGSDAMQIAWAISPNGWGLNWQSIIARDQTIREAFTRAGTDPHIVATAGVAGKAIIAALPKDGSERKKIAGNVMALLAGTDPGSDYNEIPTVEAVRTLGKRGQDWDVYAEKLYKWQSCAYPNGGSPEESDKAPVSGCGKKPKLPETCKDQDGIETPFHRGGSVMSVVTRRWLQAEKEEPGSGDFLVWAYRVWAVVLAADLGLSEASYYAKIVLTEGKDVPSGFGKQAYLGYLETITVDRTASLVTEAALAENLTGVVTPAPIATP